MKEGEVRIDLPDPAIDHDEFLLNYEEYKLLLNQKKARDDLERKIELVEQRKKAI